MNNKFCFLGGAPKCGTSSMFYWLSTHPELSPSKIKETFFLMDNTNPLANKKSNIHIDGFEVFLNNFSEPNKLLLEGTTHLLYQKQIADFLKRKSPESKFIFVLRNPIDRLFSSFNYTKNNLLRINDGLDLNQFISILRSGNREVLGEYINDEKSLYVLSRDLEYGCYSNYLKDWIEVFGIENIEIKIFEDLKNNPKEEIFNTCGFLNIDKSHFSNFSFNKENESLSIKHKALFKVVKKIGGILPQGAFMKKQIKGLFSDKSEITNKISSENLSFLLDFYKNEFIELKKLGVHSSFKGWPNNN